MNRVILPNPYKLLEDYDHPLKMIEKVFSGEDVIHFSNKCCNIYCMFMLKTEKKH